MTKLRNVPGIVDVDSSLIFGKPELGVTVARSKASDLGVSVADVADTLRVLVGGDKVSAFDDGGEQYDVYLRARPEDRADEASLKRFNVPSLPPRRRAARGRHVVPDGRRARRRSGA